MDDIWNNLLEENAISEEFVIRLLSDIKEQYKKSDKVLIVDAYYNKVKSLTDDGTVKQIVAISPTCLFLISSRIELIYLYASFI